MRILFGLATLLYVLSAPARAGTLGISGEWAYYGDQDAAVRIDEKSGILEDATNRTSYVLLKAQGGNRRRVAKRGGSHPGDVRNIVRVQENVLLFLGVKNPILVRKGARFKIPREKIRGRWHYAEQTNETFYYDAEFDLDAGRMVDISRAKNGEHTRNEGRPIKMLLDAQAELALRAGDTVYHFARLGADFLVLEPKYATSTQNGHKILMERVRAPQTDERRVAAKPQANAKRKGAAAAPKRPKAGKTTERPRPNAP